MKPSLSPLRQLVLTAALMATLTGSSALLGPAPATAQETAATEPARKNKVALVRLSGELQEKPPSFRFSLLDMTPAKAPALSTLITTLGKAAKDPALAAVVLDLNAFHLSLSQAQELTPLIRKLREAQKLVVVYAADYDTATYVMASSASVVAMPENGDLLMPGVSLNMMFFRGLLDNLKIAPDFIQVGKYKGAEEPFTRTSPSPEYKAQIESLVDGMFGQIKSAVAANRPNLTAEEVSAAIDEGWITGKHAKELKLVDQTFSRDKLEHYLETTLGAKPEFIKDYGQPKKRNIDLDSPFAILQMLAPPKTSAKSKDPAVAVIYADGTIMPDLPEGTDESESFVTPSRMRKAVDKALKDDLVKAIVLRIDSPGGSASASDEIWQILRDADKKKPVTVSMGRVAASGGYYIACAGRSITADPATITGSIGVVGGKLVLTGLLEKVGVNVEPVTRGKHAGMFSLTKGFSPEEKDFIRKQMTEVYDLFKSRVKDGRGDKIKEVEDVAAGRLFTGPAAKQAGLVDNVGTLSDTVLAAAKASGIDKNYQILVYPEAKTLSDLLRESLTVDASLPLDLRTALKAVPAAYRQETLRMLQVIQALQKERVMLALPVGLVEQP